jgi:hypothetical protein
MSAQAAAASLPAPITFAAVPYRSLRQVESTPVRKASMPSTASTDPIRKRRRVNALTNSRAEEGMTKNARTKLNVAIPYSDVPALSRSVTNMRLGRVQEVETKTDGRLHD